MVDRIAGPKDMDSPSDNIIVLSFVHIFPHKFMSVSQGEDVNMEFSCSCENVSLPTKLFCPSNSYHLHFNCVDVISLVVRKVYDDFLEAVIRSVV